MHEKHLSAPKQTDVETYDTVCVCVCMRSGLMDLELGTFVSRNCQLCVSQPPDNMDADVKCVSTSTSFTE